MSYTYLDLQDEVKTRSTRNQSGNEFTTRIKNVINTTVARVAREAKWRTLRRISTFDTVAAYSTGTGAVSVTNGSKNVTITGATLLTDGVHIGRRIDLGGSTLPYVVKEITGETTLVLNQNYDGTTSSTQTYKIFGQEEYNIPLHAGS